MISGRMDKDREDLPVERKYSFKSGINIMFGCNNFRLLYCPLCPRRERSRNPKGYHPGDRGLVADGVVRSCCWDRTNLYGKNLVSYLPLHSLQK